MTRRPLRAAGVLCLAITLALAGAWISRNLGTSSRPASSVPVVSASTLVPTPLAAEVALPPTGASTVHDLHVVDRITGEPIAGARIESISTRGVAVQVVTSSTGCARLEDRGAAPVAYRVHLEDWSGSRTATLAADAITAGDSASEMLLLVPLTSRLELTIEANQPLRGRVRWHPYPQEIDDASSTRRSSLGTTPCEVPSVRLEKLVERGRVPAAAIVDRSFDTSRESTLSLDVPYEGPAMLTVVVDEPAGFRPGFHELRMEAGAITDLVSRPEPMPRLRGVLLDELGQPAPGQTVTLSVSSDFTPAENYPWTDLESGNPAFALRQQGERWLGIAQKSVRTGDDGAFDVAMPYTDRVALWCYPADGRQAYLELALGDRHRARDGIELRLARMARAQWMQLVNALGAPLAEVRLEAALGDHPFLLSIPLPPSDRAGFVDVSCLESDREYTFCDADHAPARAVVRDGNRVILERAENP